MTIACPDCGTLQDLPRLEAGTAAICPTCTNWMERTSGRSVAAGLACSLATFLLLFPANLLPLMGVSVLGMTRQSQISSGVAVLWRGQWVIVATLVAAFVMVLPFVRFGLLAAVLANVYFRRCPRWLGPTSPGRARSRQGCEKRPDHGHAVLPPGGEVSLSDPASLKAVVAGPTKLLGGGAASPNGNLQQAVHELTGTARAIRTLANYLDQHPEALIRGRGATLEEEGR